MDATAPRLPNMNSNKFGCALRRFRLGASMSLGGLAARLYCNHSYISAIEAGRRWPLDRGFAEGADLAVNAGGELVGAWDVDQRERARAEDTMRMLADAQRVVSKCFSRQTRHRLMRSTKASWTSRLKPGWNRMR